MVRSACPHCRHILTVGDLIPIFSWLFLRGCCRYCREAISLQYIFLESLSLLVAIGIYLFSGWHLESFVLLALLPFMLTQIMLLYQYKSSSKQLWIIVAFIALFYVFLQF